jgi:predicted GIY-YIG superfamily endonuclease
MNHATVNQLKFLRKRFRDLLAAQPLHFADLTPSKVPKAAGVYVISVLKLGPETPYYVGRTKNLKQRLYTNHLMGSAAGARLKKHLVQAGECADMATAKAFLRTYCLVRWIEQLGHRERGAIEGYCTGLLFPKYGIYEEH